MVRASLSRKGKVAPDMSPAPLASPESPPFTDALEGVVVASPRAIELDTRGTIATAAAGSAEPRASKVAVAAATADAKPRASKVEAAAAAAATANTTDPDPA